MGNNNDKILEGLITFKEKFNNVIDECIENTKNDKSIDDVDNLSIGALKFLFENVSDNLYDDKMGKKILKEYVNSIKNDNGLKNFFTLFEMIKNANGINDTKTYVNEALDFKKKQDKKSVKKLSNIVKESLKYTHLNHDDINNILKEYDNSIDSSLSFILSENKNKYNINEYTNNLVKVNEWLGDRSEVIKEDEEISKSEILDSLNRLMNESSNEREKELLKDITLNIISGKDKSELYEDYKNECISIINECIDNTENITEKNNFQTMKDKLLEKEYKEEKFIDDIIKLSEFKETLENG